MATRLELDIGVGVIGSNGDSSGVWIDEEGMCRGNLPGTRNGEDDGRDVYDVGKTGEIVWSVVRGRVRFWRLTRDDGGGKINFCGSDLTLHDELKKKRYTCTCTCTYKCT